MINFLLGEQRSDGGWGFFGRSTLEETSHCVIGLYHAACAGLLADLTPLRRAARFFNDSANGNASERLWIGKTLYRPEAIVRATLHAAILALRQLRCEVQLHEERVA